MRNFSRTLAPETLNAQITIHADGGYSYAFEGTLAFPPVLAETVPTMCNPQLETRLQKAAQWLRGEGFDDVQYLGRGRYFVRSQRAGVKCESCFLPSSELRLIGIRPSPDGRMIIGALRADPVALRQFLGANAPLRGALDVRVSRAVKVLEHNAAQAPSEDGGFAKYDWRLGAEEPFIVVKA